MNGDSERIRRDIEQLLRGLRQDLVQWRVTLYREHLAEDATLLASDNPQLFHGKEEVLGFLRDVGQLAQIRSMDAEVEDFKRLGDVAVVLERHTAHYDARGKAYRDSGRTTWVLFWDQTRWLVTHIHWESLALNRIVAPAP